MHLQRTANGGRCGQVAGVSWGHGGVERGAWAGGRGLANIPRKNEWANKKA